MNKKSMVGVVSAICFCAFLAGAMTSVFTSAQNENPTTYSAVNFPTFSFTKNLRRGDDNQDVRQLQIVLNKDESTKVATEGVGSPGFEGTYFGSMTFSAVVRFQIKNNISPTGFVGPLTRQKLNSLMNVNVGATTTNTTTTTTTASASGSPLPLAKEVLPRLYTTRPQQIKKTDTFTIVGAGFMASNKLHIGAFTFDNVLPQDSNNISFRIPATSTIENGTYNVWLENSYGSSQVQGQNITLIITDNPVAPPTITSVTPQLVSGTESVTVSGTGFSSSGNSVVSGFGTLKDVSSNGNQITFSPKSLLTADVLKTIPAGTTIKIDFYVMVGNAVSNIAGSVNLKL